MPCRILLVSVAALVSACGASAPALEETPPDCEVRYAGGCYPTQTAACEAARCPSERCLMLDSYPSQVHCEGEPPITDDLPNVEPIAPAPEAEMEQSNAGSDLTPEPAGADTSYRCDERCMSRSDGSCAYFHQPFADCRPTPRRPCPSARGMTRECDARCCADAPGPY